MTEAGIVVAYLLIGGLVTLVVNKVMDFGDEYSPLDALTVLAWPLAVPLLVAAAIPAAMRALWERRR